MRILQFQINGQKLSKDGDFSELIAGTKGYLYTAYNFDGKCAVPDEIAKYKRQKVYLVGERKGYRITTNEVEVRQS